ncbi:DUF3617 domain-containing protein [Undibacterium sp. TJN25]|uniref:DUF3617 domain-containing protein n=1 Tax=Undibacterium sp. TJN25 TaxID=3413056 RepID=UPI003BF285AA
MKQAKTFPITQLSMLALPLLCVAAYSHAAGTIKPGLWEMRMEMDPAQAQMAAQMAKLPPEQLAQMNKMGIKLPQIQGNTVVQKVCLTKEMIESEHPPAMSKEQSMCQPRNFVKSSGGYSMDITCDSPDFKGTGSTRSTFVSPESITSVYDFKGTARNMPINQHHESKGKWLGASCGDVQPLTAPPAAK